MQTTIVMFAVLLMLVGCKAGNDPTTAPGAQLAEGFIDAGNWKAWINRMPMNSPTLHVEGAVTLAATNFSPELKFDRLSKSNPPELTLRLQVNKTGEMGGMMISEKPVRYEDQQNLHIGAVHILYPDGKMHTITRIEMAQ